VAVDRLLGKIGTVIEPIEPGDGGGKVRVEREEWRADSPAPEMIPAGTKIVVERVRGTHLVVRVAEPVSEDKE
ncbi:MAG TPA: NfeD family protein, partial [Coriobacteriia bacterium]|nr:NfeD family protein [Coriobacteriia bacterium]